MFPIEKHVKKFSLAYRAVSFHSPCVLNWKWNSSSSEKIGCRSWSDSSNSSPSMKRRRNAGVKSASRFRRRSKKRTQQKSLEDCKLREHKTRDGTNLGGRTVTTIYDLHSSVMRYPANLASWTNRRHLSPNRRATADSP